ncbi:MAG: hypothetical protein WA885_05505 [Phormidesmis sp.]
MKNNQLLCCLLIVTLIALLLNLNSWGVLEASEARYAEPMILSAVLVLIMPIWACSQFSQPGLRPGVMALASVLAIALYGGYFLGANELLLGGTRPVAQFIQTLSRIRQAKYRGSCLASCC